MAVRFCDDKCETETVTASHCSGVRILLVGLIFFNCRSTYVCLIMTGHMHMCVCLFEREGIVRIVNIRVLYIFTSLLLLVFFTRKW